MENGFNFISDIPLLRNVLRDLNLFISPPIVKVNISRLPKQTTRLMSRQYDPSNGGSPPPFYTDPIYVILEEVMLKIFNYVLTFIFQF